MIEWSWVRNVLVGFILFLMGFQYVRRKDHLVAVTYEAALEGAKLLREWCTWLATISTASIGGGFLVKESNAGHMNDPVAQFGMISFGITILITATLLLALPSLVTRLDREKEPTTKNDIYEATAFLWVWKAFVPLFRVGHLAFIQYYFFVIGVGCFIAYVLT